MAFKAYMNGREVTNPASKAVLWGFMMAILAAVLGVIALFVIPGVALAVGAGLLLVAGGTAVYVISRVRRVLRTIANPPPSAEVQEAEFIELDENGVDKRLGRRLRGGDGG